MKFASKIFFSILITTTVSCILVAALIYSVFKKDIELEYFERYRSLGEIISNTFHQMEITTDMVNKNAVAVLALIEKSGKIPTDQELDKLAKHLGINSFYVLNKQGRFLRSSDLPIKKQVNSLFSYSDKYRLLVDGNANIALTPIIPSFPYDIPAKFAMIPNYNRTLILEAGIQLQYIGKILHNAIGSDENIQSIGLYAPTGYELGYIDSSGKFYQGRRDANTKLFIGRKILGNSVAFSLEVPASVENCYECIEKGVSTDGKYYYVLTIKVSLLPLYSRLNTLKYQLLMILLAVLLITTLLSKMLSKRLVDRIATINKTADSIIKSGNLDLRVDVKNSKDELGGLATRFNQMIEALKKSQDNLIETEKMRSIAQLASQVAHDIRSPLVALDSVTKDLTGIAEGQRNIMRNAMHRINDIANNLLTQYRDGTVQQTAEPRLISAEPVVAMLDSLISEKRAQYAAQGITFKFEIPDYAHGEFIKINAVEFKRVISNLLNNAAEAVKIKEGRIAISLTRTLGKLRIEIKDNGCGIPQAMLPKILEGGISIGKQHGSGLGIAHAVKSIEQWGGDFDIKSVVDEGTQVGITLPCAKPADWFADQLVFNQDSTVVILDDDDFIHEIWTKRFKQSFAALDNIRVIKFRSPDELVHYHQENATLATHYLLDYELTGHTQTGLDLIKQLDIADAATLVTSRYEDTAIRATCHELGIKILPKSYALYIPINLIYKNPDLIFIDDNVALTDAWKFQGERVGKRVVAFNSLDDFLKIYATYKKDIPIYIDSDLQANMRGEELAEWLFAQGYTNLYLATGYASQQFESMPWIKGVVSKEFPD